jgi:hypothetical protein
MSSVTILIVEKLGNIKELTLKTYNEAELYKKAGYKTAEGFQCHAQWNVEELNGKPYGISVYGKTTGRANQENKYEFPPPIDTTLFFGSCVIVNKTEEGVVSNISESEWTTVYEYLYGGFEDIDDEDTEDEDEDEDDGLPKTKSGYAKDGFVVDDEEVEEDEEEDDEDEDEDYEDDDEDDDEPRKSKSKSKPKAKPKAKPIKKTTKKSSVVLENVFTKVIKEAKAVVNEATADDNYLECTSELSEESYV